MPTCETPQKADSSDVSFYSLKCCDRAAVPLDFRNLVRWLTKNGCHPTWDGKMYVASTIYWDSHAREFRQTGCSPNYRAGWWSLACCKHDMRTARPFRDKAIDLSIPTYVFTLASLDRALGQPIVSAAQVTQCFSTMDDYAEFLRKQRDRALISSRSTRARRNDGLLGWRFGDCHADMSGEVGEPHPLHVHYPNKYWQTDVNGKHMILASDRFLVWEEPVFLVAKTQKQSRYGKDIDSRTLNELLTLAPQH
jgi:hypothetical protein